MTLEEMRSLGQDCYAAFNAKPPDFASRAWILWAEMCAEVGTEALAYIRGKIIELDSMPRNFGKAVRSLWHEWRSEKGQVHQSQADCDVCDKQTPGFFTVWRRCGNRVLCRCRCNHDKGLESIPYRTPADMVELGYIVRPQGYAGSFLQFENERFAPAWKRQGDDPEARKAQVLAQSPQWDERMRPRHLEQLSLAEA